MVIYIDGLDFGERKKQRIIKYRKVPKISAALIFSKGSTWALIIGERLFSEHAYFRVYYIANILEVKFVLQKRQKLQQMELQHVASKEFHFSDDVFIITLMQKQHYCELYSL